MNDPTFDHTQEKVERAKPQLIAAGKKPVCRCCGQKMPKDCWRSVYEMVQTVYADKQWKAGESAAISIALRDLIDEGVFEQEKKTLRIRLKR